MSVWEKFFMVVIGCYGVLATHWCWMLSTRVMRLEKIMFKNLYPDEKQ